MLTLAPVALIVRLINANTDFLVDAPSPLLGWRIEPEGGLTGLHKPRRRVDLRMALAVVVAATLG